MWRYLGDSRADIQSRRQRNADLGCLLFDTVWWCWPSVPIFPRVPALLGDQLRRIAAIQASTLAGVPHVQPDELGSMADRQFPVLPRVPHGHGRSPRRHRMGCPFMIGDVPFGQARPLCAVLCVDALVRGQMPAVQLSVLFDVAVFDSRVF